MRRSRSAERACYAGFFGFFCLWLAGIALDWRLGGAIHLLPLLALGCLWWAVSADISLSESMPWKGGERRSSSRLAMDERVRQLRKSR